MLLGRVQVEPVWQAASGAVVAVAEVLLPVKTTVPVPAQMPALARALCSEAM